MIFSKKKKTQTHKDLSPDYNKCINYSKPFFFCYWSNLLMKNASCSKRTEINFLIKFALIQQDAEQFSVLKIERRLFRIDHKGRRRV